MCAALKCLRSSDSHRPERGNDVALDQMTSTRSGMPLTCDRQDDHPDDRAYHHLDASGRSDVITI